MMKYTSEIAAEILNAPRPSLEWWARYTIRLRLYKAVARAQEVND